MRKRPLYFLLLASFGAFSGFGAGCSGGGEGELVPNPDPKSNAGTGGASGGVPATGGVDPGVGGAAEGGDSDTGGEAGADAPGGADGASGAGGAAPTAGSGGEPKGPWTGVECEPVSSDPVRPYFEVPSAEGAEESDFFRLPFPNDIRRTDDGLDLSGYPSPGKGSLGVDPVALYVDAIEATDSAWGSDPTTLFRFSGTLDTESLHADVSVRYVDVTEGADTFGDSRGVFFFYTNERTRYVCENWLGVRRPPGAPLSSGHTYAVYVTTEVLAADGSPLEPSTGFASVIGDEEPAEPALAAAHAAYAPFRAYLAAFDVDPRTIATAAVFTVGELERTMTELAAAVESEPAPEVSGDWVKCDADVESPCPQNDGERGCGGQAAAFDEWHALVTLPSYQRGTAPFYFVADGGGVDASEPPEAIDVCLALTIPKGTAPAAGFPLVVTAHGTGGSFRSHVTNAGIAEALSSGDVQFAVLGIDQVSHGTRRGGTNIGPELLFFNFQNPAAARGNPLQGAVDQLALARFAETLDGSGGEPAKIDPTRIVFFGHSQGATEGSLAIPFADRFVASVLSGNGGSLQRSLLTKTKPVDLTAILPTLLADLSIDEWPFPPEYHPVLSLLQQWIDPADPLNFARFVAADPLPGHGVRHTFQTYGLGDTYSPPSTLSAYVLAGGFTQVAPELEPLGLGVVDPPLAANYAGATLGFRQYEPPAGEDGHFVAFSVPEANADVVRFLSMAVSGDAPAIGK